jgi:hypothetical protein
MGRNVRLWTRRTRALRKNRCTKKIHVHGQWGNKGQLEKRQRDFPVPTDSGSTPLPTSDQFLDRRRHSVSGNGPVNSVRGTEPVPWPRPARPTILRNGFCAMGSPQRDRRGELSKQFGLTPPQPRLAAGEQGIWGKDTSE